MGTDEIMEKRTERKVMTNFLTAQTLRNQERKGGSKGGSSQ
jgi:hypothetical protein